MKEIHPMPTHRRNRRRITLTTHLACYLTLSRTTTAFRPSSPLTARPLTRLHDHSHHHPLGYTNYGDDYSDPPLPRGFTYEEDHEEHDYIPSHSSDLFNDDSFNSNNNNNLSQPSSDINNVHSSSNELSPEVNKWTTLMTSGTNAAIHRPGKEMTLQEGIEILYNDLKDLSSQDYDNIEQYWEQLCPTVSYLGSHAVWNIQQSLRVAYRAHRGQARKSGEPFIIHPVEVALLLSGMKMDAPTVMAGLLHDTVEDTDLTFEQVEAMFGQEVKNIVEGETKVSKLPKLVEVGGSSGGGGVGGRMGRDDNDEQAENLRQMFVAMTDDYRIIIVKVSAVQCGSALDKCSGMNKVSLIHLNERTEV